MILSDETRTELRAKAEKATPGPWKAYASKQHRAISHVDIPDAMHPTAWSRDAEFIAATDPTTVLALLDENEQLRAVVDRVRAIHEPVDALNVYAWNWRAIQQVCTGCGQDDGNWQRWPCPTIRALDWGE